MKRLLTILACTALLFGCKYDDGDVWKKIDDLDARVEAIEKQLEPLNREVKALRTIVDALNDGYVIMDTKTIENGYVITFSNEKTITITNGSNGINAPVLGVKLDSDGKYYWTLDGEFYMPDGSHKLPATGDKGETGPAGTAGVTPVMGVDAQGYWTVDTGDGPQRILVDGQPVSALGEKGETGDKGDSLFEDVRPGDTSVTFVLNGGLEIVVPKIEANVKLAFADPDDVKLYWGDNEELEIEAAGLKSALITAPCNWQASVNLTTGKVQLKAPSIYDTAAEQQGFISIIAVTDNGHTVTASKAVATSDEVSGIAKIEEILKEIIAPAADESTPVDLTFTLTSPKSDYSNLTSIPAAVDAATVPSITINFNEGITTSVALGSYNSTYDGEIIVTMPDGKTSAYMTIQLPNGTARISGGQHKQIKVQLKEYATIDQGTEITAMELQSGNLVNFGTITSLKLQASGVVDPEMQILNYGKIGEITETNGKAVVIAARPRSAGSSKWISKVMEYRPAPGQFTNMQITWSLPENISNIEGGQEYFCRPVARCVRRLRNLQVRPHDTQLQGLRLLYSRQRFQYQQ